MTTKELNALYASLRDFRITHTETDSEESRAIYEAMMVISTSACSGDGDGQAPAMCEQAVRITALDMAVKLYSHGPQHDVSSGTMADLAMEAAPVFADWIRDGAR
jgi:hypothetical protein